MPSCDKDLNLEHIYRGCFSFSQRTQWLTALVLELAVNEATVLLKVTFFDEDVSFLRCLWSEKFPKLALCKIRGFLICVYRKLIGNVMRNVVGNLSKPKDTACFHVFCEKLGKNLVILPCPGVSLPKKHHVSPHFPLGKPHILRSVELRDQ